MDENSTTSELFDLGEHFPESFQPPADPQHCEVSTGGLPVVKPWWESWRHVGRHRRRRWGR